jgi:BASS family bile acid:Na+ symporter
LNYLQYICIPEKLFYSLSSFEVFMETFNKLFPIWAILFSAAAYLYPPAFLWFKSYIVYGLALIMFGMGSTITWESFKDVARKPFVVFIGVFLQYAAMPLMAFLISRMLNLTPAQTIGMVLLGSCPGGTASNVICYLAGANVTLSVTLTVISTLLAVFLTPFLTYFYVNTSVDVPALNMLISVAKIVLVPVILGALLNGIFKEKISGIKKVFPSLSVVIIVMLIAAIIALNKENIAQTGIILFAAVLIHNFSGLTIGYFIPKMLGFDKESCRTISIEVGMQNSGLSVALAVKHFATLPAATLPGAIFSIWHNISGSTLASIWKSQKS